MIDIVVLGAGLAGLAAARDLSAAGADVVVLEARDRPGGRVEAAALPDGRAAQAGGEVFGRGHRAYGELVGELGLTIQPSYVADPGEITWGLAEGVFIGDDTPWMDDRERTDGDRIDAEFARLAATVDPGDPWRHPDAQRLDQCSVGAWLRDQGALPAVRRRHELSSLSLSCDAPDRTSLLAALRKHATLAGSGLYDLDAWEGLRVAEGSAAVAQKLAAELGERVRLGAVVRAIEVGAGGVRVELDGGEPVQAEAVLCTLPAGPLRAVRIDGLSDARLRSLHAQRHALAAKIVVAYEESFWQSSGQNGLAETEWLFGSTWPQGANGVMSLLVPPERFAAFLAAPAPTRRQTVLDGLAALYGERARRPVAMLERAWGSDPFTLGYISSWAPGDLGRVGPLHGTHEPPFYVAGSDHWVAGYMEGAVKTGRAAARAALGERSLA